MPTFGTPAYAGRSATATSLTVPAPPGIFNGGVVIVALRAQEANGDLPWIAPEGFTLVSPDPVLPSNTVRVGAVFVKQVNTADEEPDSYVFTGPRERAVAISVACLPDQFGPIERQIWGPYGGSSQTNGTVSLTPSSQLGEAPAISLVALSTELISGIALTSGETPDGFIEIGAAQSSLDSSTSGTRTGLWLGWRLEEDRDIETLSGGWTGSSGPAIYLGAFTGGQSVPTEPEPEPEPEPGFRSVAQMLATPGATWAHRGGSANWPEMTEYAYRQAALAGYGALEFSAARTSDGVWFGLHDENIDRTSQVSGSAAASSMTWAQVQGNQVTLNAGGTPRPYWRLVDFLDTYAETHVCIVDFKYAWAHIAEFWSILQQYPRKNIVVKFHGPSSHGPTIKSVAATNGWATWGYYYAADLPGLAATQGNWTILGMEHVASQSVWDEILAYGKPVVGHICANETHVSTARSKGAHMVQVSGVASVPAQGRPLHTQAWDAVYVDGSRIPAKAVRVGSTQVWPLLVQ